jgi:hypothetical protein
MKLLLLVYGNPPPPPQITTPKGGCPANSGEPWHSTSEQGFISCLQILLNNFFPTTIISFVYETNESKEMITTPKLNC